MKELSKKVKTRRIKKVMGAFFALLVLLGVGFGIYVSDYYHVGNTAQELLESKEGSFSVEEQDSCFIVSPAESDSSVNGKGIIFYPGAKVEASSYLPLACEFANEGIICIIAKMPFNLAFFGIDSANTLYSLAPNVTSWWIGGHSLGGAMASQYAASNSEKLKGILLCGAYAATDLSQTQLKAVVIYGSEDGVLNHDKLELNEQYLPEQNWNVVIEGGNHSGFGDYGPQKGDGERTISATDQQKETVAAVISAMNS